MGLFIVYHLNYYHDCSLYHYPLYWPRPDATQATADGADDPSILLSWSDGRCHAAGLINLWFCRTVLLLLVTISDASHYYCINTAKDHRAYVNIQRLPPLVISLPPLTIHWSFNCIVNFAFTIVSFCNKQHNYNYNYNDVDSCVWKLSRVYRDSLKYINQKTFGFGFF